MEKRRPRAHHERRPYRFCSRRCKSAASGGVYFNPAMGRWIVVCRDGTTMLRARVVMAGHLGRFLDRDEVVHHINEDPTDDRIENLQVLSPGDHVRLHLKGKPQKGRQQRALA